MHSGRPVVAVLVWSLVLKHSSMLDASLETRFEGMSKDIREMREEFQEMRAEPANDIEAIKADARRLVQRKSFEAQGGTLAQI